MNKELVSKPVQVHEISGCVDCPFCVEYDMAVGYGCRMDSLQKRQIKQDARFNPITPDWCVLQNGEVVVKQQKEHQLDGVLCAISQRQLTNVIAQCESTLRLLKYVQKEQERLYEIRVKAFRSDLEAYFGQHPVYHKIQAIELSKDGYIIPRELAIADYDGQMDEHIETLCKTHNVSFKMAYWCYAVK